MTTLPDFLMTRRLERFVAAVLMETFLWPMTWADGFDANFRLPFKMMRSPIGDVFTRGMNVMINKLIPERGPPGGERGRAADDRPAAGGDGRGLSDVIR